MNETLGLFEEAEGGFQDYPVTNALVDAAIKEVMEVLEISDDSEA